MRGLFITVDRNNVLLYCNRSLFNARWAFEGFVKDSFTLVAQSQKQRIYPFVISLEISPLIIVLWDEPEKFNLQVYWLLLSAHWHSLSTLTLIEMIRSSRLSLVSLFALPYCAARVTTDRSADGHLKHTGISEELKTHTVLILCETMCEMSRNTMCLCELKTGNCYFQFLCVPT